MKSAQEWFIEQARRFKGKSLTMQQRVAFTNEIQADARHSALTEAADAVASSCHRHKPEWPHYKCMTDKILSLRDTPNAIVQKVTRVE